MTTTPERRILAWCSVSLDGYSSGPRGPEHDAWLSEHAMHEATSEYVEGIWRGCSSVLLGRTNYVGFDSVWPGITRDPATAPRIRALGQWLDTVDKVVVSTTLTDAPWANSRIFPDLRLADVPVMVGGGLRLLPEDVTGTWRLVSSAVLPHGAIAVHYRRRDGADR